MHLVVGLSERKLCEDCEVIFVAMAIYTAPMFPGKVNVADWLSFSNGKRRRNRNEFKAAVGNRRDETKRMSRKYMEGDSNAQRIRLQTKMSNTHVKVYASHSTIIIIITRRIIIIIINRHRR